MYYDVQTCRLDARNDKGDAALHMAARWGYEGIIQVLLENGASTDVLNKSKDSPLQCALNSKVRSRSDCVSDLVPPSDQLKCRRCVLSRRSWRCCRRPRAAGGAAAAAAEST